MSSRLLLNLDEFGAHAPPEKQEEQRPERPITKARRVGEILPMWSSTALRPPTERRSLLPEGRER